jgi:L-seryl-tRNA(Ser) seleniumtransferase
MRHLYHPFDPEIKPHRQIVVPKGHNVDYGTPVELMVALGGGILREAGYANICTADHLRQQMSEHVAAILYVKSHHTVQKSMLTVKEAAMVAREYDVPLIVDAAAEEDVFAYMKAGADLVIYSGAKAFEGPSSGLVIGKKQYIEWVRLQSKGIGRAMKIGKENILGLVSAIETYLTVGSETGASMKKRLDPFVRDLNEIQGITATIVQDVAGRDIYRAHVKVDAGIDAIAITRAQQLGNPAIYSRDYQANHGVIEYDIRAVNQVEMEEIVVRLKEIVRSMQ